MTHRFSSALIENPAAYEAAIARRIKANASKTRSAKWLAEEGNSRLREWLYQTGEFKPVTTCIRPEAEHMWVNEYDEYNREPQYHWCDDCREIAHPTTKGMFSGDFGKVLYEMQEALSEWGGLTDKQTALVRNALARAEKWESEKQAKFAAKRAEDMAHSDYVGVVGQRQEFTLTVERVHSYDTDFGTTYINICKDGEGHTVVYKGSNGWDKGLTLTVKATVKEHSEYEGLKQTMISRPKVLSNNAAVCLDQWGNQIHN